MGISRATVFLLATMTMPSAISEGECSHKISMGALHSLACEGISVAKLWITASRSDSANYRHPGGHSESINTSCLSVMLLDDPSKPEPNATYDPKEVLKIFLSSLTPADWKTQIDNNRSTYAILGYDKGRFAVDSLMATLKDGPSRGVFRVSSLLGAVDSNELERVVPALVDMLSSQDPYRRGAAAGVLASMGPRAKAATPHLELLLRDDFALVRVRAARALWRITADVKQALPVLVACLKEQPKDKGIDGWSFPTTRSLNYAVWTLGEMRMITDDTRAEMMRLFQTGDNTLRYDIAGALAKVGVVEPMAIEFLLVRLRAIGHTPVRAVAARLLVDLKDYRKEATDTMVELMAFVDADAYHLVLHNLEKFPIEAERKTACLLKALQNRNAFVRQMAVWELGLLGAAAKFAVPQLRQLQQDSDRFVRWQVAGALRAIEGP